MNDAARNTTISALFALLAACGGTEGRGAGSSSTMPAEAPIDRVTFALHQVSSTNDCDPAKGNPGDFEAFLQVYTKDDFTEFGPWNLVASSEPRRFKIDAEKGDGKTVRLDEELSLDLPRRDGQGFLVVAHALEKDSGREDAHLEGTASYYFDADLDCWYSTDKKRCGSQGFSKGRTFRKDEFKLFNSDDEGCQIAMTWSATLSND